VTVASNKEVLVTKRTSMEYWKGEENDNESGIQRATFSSMIKYAQGISKHMLGHFRTLLPDSYEVCHLVYNTQQKKIKSSAFNRN